MSVLAYVSYAPPHQSFSFRTAGVICQALVDNSQGLMRKVVFSEVVGLFGSNSGNESVFGLLEQEVGVEHIRV